MNWREIDTWIPYMKVLSAFEMDLGVRPGI